MAGKLNYYDYKSDNGSEYVVFMDESNAVAVGNVDAAAGGTGLPTEISPRYITYSTTVGSGAAARKISRRVIVGDVENVKWTSPGPLNFAVDGGPAIPFFPTSATGERRTRLGQFGSGA